MKIFTEGFPTTKAYKKDPLVNLYHFCGNLQFVYIYEILMPHCDICTAHARLEKNKTALIVANVMCYSCTVKTFETRPGSYWNDWNI